MREVFTALAASPENAGLKTGAPKEGTSRSPPAADTPSTSNWGLR